MKTFFLLVVSLLVNSVFAQNNASNWTFDQSNNKSFIENKGQFDGRTWNSQEKIEYAYSQNPFYIFFSTKGITYRFDQIIKNPKHKTNPNEAKRTNISEIISASWIGANEKVDIIAEEVIPSYFSYAIKDKTTREVSNINHIKGFKKITYVNLYDNIDVEYLIHPEHGVKYNVILHPGADASKLRLEYNFANTNVQDEKIEAVLNERGEFEINTSLGQIIEHKPATFYNSSHEEIKSSYSYENNILEFTIENYDHSKKVIIDPWITSPTYTTSTAVWEVETDGIGNVYSIGGETPMELKKYSILGTLLWTYTTPWDTSTVWLGTLATDVNGVSYVTSGTAPEIERVDVNGNMVWNAVGPGGPFALTEYWSITFNCDNTKLIVGGTGGSAFAAQSMIYNIDVNNGSVISDIEVGIGAQGGFTPVEVRSISSSKNAKYIYLTHQQVGAINQNIGFCPNELPIFEVDNQDNLAYKCEDYLPATQNGGGLKALVANDTYLYSHAGDQIRQWDLTNGALINTVTLTGGVANSVFGGGIVVENSGLDVDDCGNVYAGSKDRVVKFDANLNVISQSLVSFNVYDVSVNANGEVIAGGAQSNNAAPGNRNGRIEAINMTACAQFTLICCDANICAAGPFCETDAPFALVTTTLGGTWSGTGVDAFGNFDPALAGIGTHLITYTLACGTETIAITVDPCATIVICEETNGDLTASGGVGPYTWEEWGTITTPITNQTECESCGYTWFFGTCLDGATPVTDCSSTGWITYASGTTVLPPSAYPIQITDGGGSSVIINNQGELGPCVANPCAGVTVSLNIISQSDPLCFGGNDGTATVDATGGAAPYSFMWMPGSLPGATQSNLSAGTYQVDIIDNNGCLGSGSVVIGEPAELIASATSTPATCGLNDGTATGSAVGGTGAYTYSWSPSGGTNPTATGLAPNTYTVTITDQNLCTSNAVVAVTTTGGPVIALDVSTDVLCFGGNDGSATVSATGGTGPYTFSWMPGSLSGATQSALGANSYTVTVTDAGGCTDNMIVTINEPAELIASASSTPATCGLNDGTATGSAVGGTGAYTYSWSPSGGTNPTATGLAPNTYTVTITDQNLCTSNAVVAVTTTGGPVIALDVSSDVLCFGGNDGSATVSATGGTGPYTFSWMPGSLSGATQSALSANSYTVTVTDAGGCTDNVIVTINEPAELTLSSSNIIAANCGANDGSATVDALGGTGAYTYLWSPQGGTNATANNIPGGAYTVDVTDANGCIQSISITVPTLGGPTITVVSVNDVSCFAASDGDATISASGGTAPYTYLWSPTGGNAATAANLNGGNYTITVTDAAGCVSVENITILEPAQIVITETINDENCGMADGSISLSVSGGSPTYSYSWTPGLEITSSISGLSGGNYGVTVTDINGCSISEIYIVNVVGGLLVDIVPSTAIIDQGDSVQLNATGAISYVWSPATGLSCTTCSDPMATPTETTTYIVVGTDASGCSGSDTITIFVILPIEPCGDVFVPNVFSPNGDGNNDYLCVYGDKSCVVNLVYAVYNRWGQMVFKTECPVNSDADIATKIDCGWDGEFNGKPLISGAYAYKLSYVLTNGLNFEGSGNVTLVR